MEPHIQHTYECLQLMPTKIINNGIGLPSVKVCTRENMAEPDSRLCAVIPTPDSSACSHHDPAPAKRRVFAKGEKKVDTPQSY